MQKQVILSVLIAILVFPAFAQNATKIENISTKMAMDVTKKALASCGAKQFNCVVTVVDAEGVLKSQIVMDGGSSADIKGSLEKAQAAALGKKWPHLFDDAKRAVAEMGMPFYASGLTELTGGAPILIGNDIIGAIGVSGASGQDDSGNNFDTVIVNEAIKTLQGH